MVRFHLFYFSVGWVCFEIHLFFVDFSGSGELEKGGGGGAAGEYRVVFVVCRIVAYRSTSYRGRSPGGGVAGRGAVCGGAERCGAYGVVWCCVVCVECAFCAFFVTGGGSQF